MKAARIKDRSGTERITIEDVPVPLPEDGEALVEVHAAAITPTELDWDSTYTHRDGSERLPSTLAHEVSGVVVATSADVEELRVGDAVYGLTDFWRDGAAAEYQVVAASELAAKPTTLDHAHSAVFPMSALTAWQALMEHGKLVAGQRVLVHGGAGGVGSMAVQLAHFYGAEVISTATGADVDYVRSIGADRALDFRVDPFSRILRDVDLVVDTVGGDPLLRSFSVMKSGGTIVSVVEQPSEETAAMVGAHALTFLVRPDRERLSWIAELADSGQLQARVSQTLPLASAREAFMIALRGHTHGKVVLQLRPEG